MSKDDEVCAGDESNGVALVHRSSMKNVSYESFYDEQVYVDSSSVEGDEDATEEPVEAKPPSRLDITASLISTYSEQERQNFIDTFVKKYSNNLTTIHLSGQGLRRILTTEQIKALIQSVGKVHSIAEFFCFHGGCRVLTSDLIAKFLPPNLKVLMLWHFPSVSKNFAAAVRRQSSLKRVTLNFSCSRKQQMEWGCLDVCAMAFASMPQLQVLQIRCIPKTTHHEQIKTVQQRESIISPEAIVPLLNSSSITQLYLENCGLIDDHMDEVYNELPNNKALVTLDVKGNMFTDDCLYTTGRLLPVAPPQFRSLDISGVPITEAAGTAVARGMIQNNALQSLEIEGTLLRFHDEFDIPPGHTNTQWMQDINHQLRLNRAYHMATEDQSAVTTFASKQNAVSNDVTAFVAAVSAVSDNASCMFHFLRTYSHHCDRLTAPNPHMEPRQPLEKYIAPELLHTS
jgi:hypothetical protein